MKPGAALGQLLRYYRKKALLTQQELAGLISYNATVISRYESGKRLPNQPFLDAFSAALYLTPEDSRQIWIAYLQSVSQINAPGDSGTVALSSHATMDWQEAPDVGKFYGRKAQLKTLAGWITTDRSRLVGIFGLGGVGKTALAAKLGLHLKEQFEYILWRSLLNAPPLDEILADCIQFLSGQQLLELPEKSSSRISLLLDYFRRHRSLLILDNAESILCGGSASVHYRAGYEDYGQLLQRVGEVSHQSCLLLTGREKPYEFMLLEGEALPVRSLPLNGLSAAEGEAILQDRGLFGSEEAIRALIEQYSGNPLALNLIAENILDLFDGDIDASLRRNDRNTNYGDVYDVLAQQFRRLSSLEQEIMMWLVIEREAISTVELRDNLLQPPPVRTLLGALGILRQRSLIEKSAAGFSLQNVVTEYLTGRLVERVCAEIVGQSLHLFHRHALLKAQAKEYVRQSQIRLIIEPMIDRLQTLLGDNTPVVQQLIRTLTLLRKKASPEPSYAGGNILNLLAYLGYNLRGLDFSDLTVWQAHLSEVNLPDVNFTGANLAKSVFTETFDQVLSLAISPDSRLLAAGTGNGKLRLWQASNGQQRSIINAHTDWVRAVIFNPAGDLLASCSDDHTIKLWRVKDEHLLYTLTEHTGRVLSLAFSPDGRLLLSGGEDESLRVWDAKTGRCLHTLPGHTGWIWSVAFSPDGGVIASGSHDETIRLWDVKSGQCLKTWTAHSGWTGPIAFSPDGRLLASGGEDEAVKLWDLKSGQHLRTLTGHTSFIWSVAFSPDGKRLASTGQDQTVIWEVSAGKYLKALLGHTKWVRSAVFSPDGRLLVSGSDDQTIRLWDVDTWQSVKTLRGYTNQIRLVTFSADGRELISGNEDGMVRIWDVETGQCVNTLVGHGHSIWAVAISPDSRTLAVGNGVTVWLWNINANRRLNILQGHIAWIRSVAFSPDGRLLASGSEDKTVRLWEIETGQCLKILKGHSNWIWSVIFSPDGKLLASSSEDHTIRLWQVSTGQCLKTLEGHSGLVWSAAFSPDSRLLISGSSDQSVRLWEVGTGRCLKSFREHTDQVRPVAFNADARVLASGSDDQTVRLWDAHTGQCLNALQGHTSPVWSVTFSPNGNILASSSLDETIRLWDVQTGEALNTLRPDRPYERMNITGATGLSNAQKMTLKALGAIEESG